MAVDTNALGEEDHSLAQFWFSPKTLEVLCRLCQGRQSIALLSTPSIYFALDEKTRDRAVLFEYDTKWDKAGVNFQFFDYTASLADIPRSLFNKFDLVIADPPKILESVVDKYMQVIGFLQNLQGGVAFVSAMEHEAYFAMAGLFSRKFIPQESAGWAESGRFRLYTNFEQECLQEPNFVDFPSGPPPDEDDGQHQCWSYE